MFELRGYVDPSGNRPFANWFETLNPVAAAKVTKALTRMEQGNFSNVESVGSGVAEYKINFGPGYRIYFSKDGNRLVILLLGGTKKRQDRDISLAQAHWADYKRRRKHAPYP
jgi:putative addiction module killer protein